MSAINRSSSLRRTIAITLLASLAFCSIAYYNIILLTTTSSFTLNDGDDDNIMLSPIKESILDPRELGTSNPLDEADYIVQRAYAETYARMAPCKDDDIENECIQNVVNHFNEQKLRQQQQQMEAHDNPNFDEATINNLTPLPWWFQTLLRDIPINGAYGFWHHFSTSSTNPPIKFCAIGKNGSTEWRKVFKALNAPEFGGMEKSKFNTKKELSDDIEVTPQTVFLRDPLERLLSAYLDKCVKEGVRRTQGHCEPNPIFASDWMERKANQPVDDKSAISLPIMHEASQNEEKELFAAYVDLFPLKWNVHFVPQAIFCDLYRNIGDYDTYYMGKSFMSELDRIANKYGGLLPDTLNDIFDYQLQLDKEIESEGNVGADNKHGTRAPAKVAKYYSPRAVRRALEYLSIDYVALNLEVPDWAREMLRIDNALNSSGSL